MHTKTNAYLSQPSFFTCFSVAFLHAQPSVLAGWPGGGRWPSGRVDGRCIHPALVAGAASPTGPPKTKPVTVRRGPSSKTPGPGRPQLQWGTLGVPRPPPESGVAPRRPTLAAEAPGRSCSESSLYPVSFFVPLLVARREGQRASAQALFPWEAAPLGASGGSARKRQRRWQSSVEISARARPDPGLGPHRPAARRGGGPRPVCVPGGLVAKALLSHCRGLGFNPWLGNMKLERNPRGRTTVQKDPEDPIHWR